MEGIIVLSDKEAQRARVMEQVVLKCLTLVQASEILGVGYRQAKRLKQSYVTEGLAGLAHGNRGRQGHNALDFSGRQTVLSLFEKSYSGCNDTHFTELLKEREGIVLSRETIRQILRSSGKPPKRKRRPPRHRARRPRKQVRGLMIQWDGSPHRWFGPDRPPCCLMVAVDDAEGDILGALFVPTETSVAYLCLLAMVLRRHGIPLSVYHDRHSSLVRNDNHWSLDEQLMGVQYPTHIGRVFDELGIASIRANSPQAKGRIERAFGLLQDRMIEEMRLAKVTDIESANRWLEEFYIDRHNARFGKKAAKEGSAFGKITKLDIYHHVCFAYEATVSNDNCVRLGGLMIDIPKGKNGLGYARKKVLVKQHLDGKWTVWLQDEKIATCKATEFKEPARSWKQRNNKMDPKAKQAIQVYIASKPAPPPKGHFSSAVRGTY